MTNGTNSNKKLKMIFVSESIGPYAFEGAICPRYMMAMVQFMNMKVFATTKKASIMKLDVVGASKIKGKSKITVALEKNFNNDNVSYLVTKLEMRSNPKI